MKELVPLLAAIVAVTGIAVIVLTGNSDLREIGCDTALQRIELGVDSNESIELIYKGINNCERLGREPDAKKISQWFEARKKQTELLMRIRISNGLRHESE